MNNTKYIIYWTTEDGPKSSETDDMNKALQDIATLRKQVRNGYKATHITMCAENVDQVGQMGVDSVVDRKLPDGEDYTWSKAHRAGATRGSTHSIIDNKSNE